MNLQDILNGGRKWLSATPERALDAAYRAAIKIKAIEDDHFDGQKVSRINTDYSDSVVKVFRSDVNNYLKTIKVRLTEFNSSRTLLIFSDDKPSRSSEIVKYSEELATDREEISIVEKLNFIDYVIEKYQDNSLEATLTTAELESEPQTFTEATANNLLPKKNQAQSLGDRSSTRDLAVDASRSPNENKSLDPTIETISDKTGVLPRSILRTLTRIRKEIDPQADNTEEEVLKKFRRSRNKTSISIRFLLILIIVPLFTHQFSKTFVIRPIVERYFVDHEAIVFINEDFQEEAFVELRHYEQDLHFQNLIGITPLISDQEIEDRVQVRAGELAEEYRDRGINAIGNIFADICSLIAFTAIIFFCKREILIIKSFLDEIVYGLSDSAKAFLIILLTDMFVGYHSPHGWEVILKAIANHFGLAENRDFDFLFIATFPVILDTVLKYWIFRYLNRISPSSVATYKNMNE
ncbi:CemA family [Xenococcus sp. PCC 7305]|uniref:proton extrusion protein PcxA n=1 Tax=Xenococcus sp. PCC 7305 TaxID=102125 RepID=UPI0002ABE5CA|nr:proton extrusion protein PcxA [Xenococcus sp. PCC 7305]ELS04465.1 CemA family [Xenococcus sp. PCC 7305]